MNTSPDGRRLVLLPSFNSGENLLRTVHATRSVWPVVWVVVDGSTDGSGAAVEKSALPGVRVITRIRNGGKGAAVLDGLREAHAEGFDHALVMDADGQHPADYIVPFMNLSAAHPGCLVAGVPIFGADAPAERVSGRRVGNTLALVETLGRGARDSLFGFRVYPVEPLLRILEGTRGGRRFDFDTVAAVRLAWSGVPTLNRPVPVIYPPRSEGGISHFKYLRDNLLLARVHTSLFFQLPRHIPRLWKLPCP